jgi:hypothetical protein
MPIVIDLDEASIRKLLNAPQIRAEVRRRAQLIANAAGGAPDFIVVEGTTDRARATAVTATRKGKRLESEDRALTRAIDAGRE